MSVHVIAQQVFHLPYPATGLPPLLAALIALTRHAALCAISVILVLGLGERGGWTKLATLFFCTAAFYEELLRVPVMQGIVTGAWAFAFLPQAAIYAKTFVFSAMVLVTVALAERAGDRLRKCGTFAIGGVIATLFLFAFGEVRPALEQVLMQFADPPRAEDAIRSEAYGMLILMAAYATYILPSCAMYLYFRAFAETFRGGAVAVCLLYIALLSLARGTLLISLVSIGPDFLPVFQFAAQLFVATVLICVFFRSELPGLMQAPEARRPA
ncbi:hypothetical protein [Mangrovicoccus ximenensis]|uniref:hypothetical protein n=1 Tax=Mangrovicoccus ximenensis TaxID=1911570 RepID=UPI000D3372B4|nr:hypothetical protein [Mangrovicoccus ximenensis]